MLKLKSLRSISTLVMALAGASDLPAAVLSLTDPGFEQEKTWVVELQDGAKGTIQPSTNPVRSGKRSLQVSKQNGVGAVIVRPAEPLTATSAGRFFFRIHFHADNAPLSSLLLLRVSPDSQRIAYNAAFDRSHGYSSQSLLINAPAGKWEKRVMSFPAKAGETFWPMIVLWGNPATVWIDDVSIDTDTQALPAQPGPTLSPKVSQEEVLRRLSRRPSETARIIDRNGTGELEIGGKIDIPVIYKANPYSAQNSDYAAFGQDGVQTITVGIRLGQYTTAARVWVGAKQYDFAQAEQALLDALRRNPDARVIIDLGIYPYPAWGQEHPEECWTDYRGKRGFGVWGNLEGFAGSEQETKTLAPGKSTWWYPSYHSTAYRTEAAQAIQRLIEHLRTTPMWKAVVGVFICGGQDGQFVPLHVFPDYSRPSVLAFRRWCRHTYGTIEQLNKAWKTTFKSFDQITIPKPTQPQAFQESETPYVLPGPVSDYRRFATEATWKLRDFYAGVCKKAAGKDIVTLTYVGGDYNVFGSHFLDLSNLDIFGYMTYYPYRNPGYPLGFLVPTFPQGRPRMLFQEIDLRSWVGAVYGDDIYQTWIGAGLDPREWQAINRKLVGLSIARNFGFWYYDMNRYFNNPVIHQHLSQTVRITREYFRKPPSPLRPDVAVVIGEDASPWIGPPMNCVYAYLCAAMNYQNMQFETSGVPFDVRFLSDLLSNPSQATYKVYIFYGLPHLRDLDRAKMDRVFKGKGQTLVWMYDTGYLTDGEKSVDAMSKLIGMNVRTKEEYARRTALMEQNSSNPLLKNVPPYVGASELQLTMMALKGSTTVIARYQPFRIADDRVEVLARYRETGEIAAARRQFDGWTSIYLAAPHSLDATFLNNIAVTAGAYRCGSPGQAVYMNGRFASLHGLKAQDYTFILPPGTTRVVAPETGKTLAKDVREFTFHIQPQETYWYLFE